jgi:hypothetical protein
MEGPTEIGRSEFFPSFEFDLVSLGYTNERHDVDASVPVHLCLNGKDATASPIVRTSKRRP